MRYILAFLLILLLPSYLFAESIIDKIQQKQNGIVTISTEFVKIINNPDDKNRRAVTYTRTGAGVVIDPAGIIVTNTHTVINAPLVWVILNDGKKFPAQVVFASLDHDFSLLKINADVPLTSIELANSNSANLGEQIIAVGASDLNQASLLSGEIKTILQNKSTGNIEFIEVNLSLFRGDSGGPVFDRNGRLLGIVMAKHKSSENSAVIIAANKIRDAYWHYRQNMP